MASQCAQCLQILRSSSFLQKARFRNTIQQYLHVKQYCSKSHFPEDVLSPVSNKFSGIKSNLFESEGVKKLLTRLTGLKLEKVYSSRKENLVNPTYKVIDDAELKEHEEYFNKEAEKRLKMPEVLSRRQPIKYVFSEDKEIINHDEDGADFVFTDISMSKTNKDRAVLVRENKTGILRAASWDERDRMQFMYFPKDGQHHEVVPMLQDEHLPRVFEQMRHVDALDFITIQCEPDAPDYIRVHERVYDDINKRQKYDVLHSTRHYGGMVFHYVINKKFSGLLGYYLRNDRIKDASDLVKLHKVIHDKSSFSDTGEEIGEKELVKQYLTEEGLHDLLALLEEENEALNSARQ